MADKTSTLKSATVQEIVQKNWGSMCVVDLSVMARALGSIPSTTTEENKSVIC